MFSPLVGTPLTTSAKFAVVAKSPLTGMLNDALASSHFAIAGKLTGYDAIVVARTVRRAVGPARRRRRARGSRPPTTCGACRPPRPSAGSCARRSAARWRVAAIGPAGERGVRYATVSHDGRHAGRGGLGAVMGAKNLKAVAVRAATRVAPADPEGVLAAARTCGRAPSGRRRRSTASSAPSRTCSRSTRIDTLPTRNFPPRRSRRPRASRPRT